MALATEQAPSAIAAKVVGLIRDNIPKPQNNRHDQDVTVMISGQEIGLVSCSDISSRVSPIYA